MLKSGYEHNRYALYSLILTKSVVSDLIQSTSLYKMPSLKPSLQGRKNTNLTQKSKTQPKSLNQN